MKTICSLLAMLCITGFVSAQSGVPAKATEHFSATYPGATGVKWEKEGSEFEVKFVIHDTRHEALYNAAGDWVETEYKISKEKLPAAVSSKLENQFKGYEILVVETLIRPGMASDVYEAELRTGNKIVEVVFDASGNVLSREMEEAEEEDEDGDGE